MTTVPSTDPARHYQQAVEAYLTTLPCEAILPGFSEPFTVTPLAMGEYNLNFLVDSAGRQLVFRVNLGTQIERSDQIVYEYRALEMLRKSGLTPQPYWVDDTRERIDRGISIMEYLPGTPLDYHRDSDQAARLLATLHRWRPDSRSNHLIREDRPLSLIYRECRMLLKTYFDSELHDPAIASYLEKLLEWACHQKDQERYFANDPWNCIVNTELNSGNFIVNRQRGTLHLVDWEMPRWGDPSSDLCHFLSPLTTLWKSTFRFNADGRKRFLEVYRRHTGSAHLNDTLIDRLALKAPFVYLRGISWSAMGWVSYRSGTTAIRNEDTRRKLDQYLDLSFIRTLFDPFLENRGYR